MEQLMSKLIIVDIDNAIIRVNATAAGTLSYQLRKDAAAIADALSSVFGATFRVVEYTRADRIADVRRQDAIDDAANEEWLRNATPEQLAEMQRECDGM